MTVSIVSWNVNSIKARLEHVQTYLADTKPDFIFLQELKGENLPDISPDYRAVYAGQKAYNGVAILSKSSLPEFSVIATALPGDQDDPQARYLEIDWNGIRLICIYLPNGNPVDSEKFPYKIKWMSRLYDRLAELRRSEIPFVVGGDFNVIPDARDCYDPAVWRGDALLHPATLSAWRRLLNLGLYDAYRIHDPTGADAYTFWDYQAGAWPRNLGIRIDHFLLSPTLTDRLSSCTIDRTPRGWDKASDHTPIRIELSL